MAPERDDESGKWKRAIEDPTDLLEHLEPGEGYRTTEVAEAAGLSKRGAFDYLEELEESGAVEKEKIHPRLVLWRRPEA